MPKRLGSRWSLPPVHPCFLRALTAALAFLGIGVVGVASRDDGPPPVVDLPMNFTVEVWGQARVPPLAFPPRGPGLVRDLHDARPWLRGLAATLLAEWGDDRGSSHALEACLLDEEPWVATMAARSLSRRLSPESVPALAQALRTGHVTTRREAARGLSGYPDDPMAREALADAARTDGSPWVVLIARKFFRGPPPPRFVHRGRTGPCPL